MQEPHATLALWDSPHHVQNGASTHVVPGVTKNALNQVNLDRLALLHLLMSPQFNPPLFLLDQFCSLCSVGYFCLQQRKDFRRVLKIAKSKY